MSELPEIEAVRKVALTPGDFLVIRVKGRCSAVDVVGIRDEIRRLFRWHDVVVVDGSVELSVVSKVAGR